MVIKSYDVTASSERSYTKVESTTMSMKATSDSSVVTASAEKKSAVVELSTEALRISQQTTEDKRQALQEAAKKIKQPRISTKPSYYARNASEVKIRMLEALLYAMTGKRYRGTLVEDTSEKQQQSSSADAGNMELMQFDAGSVKASRLSMDYSFEHFRYEQESVSYNAKGIINTADGKSINVDVSLSMSREFASYTSTTMQIKTETFCDPLVINYAGTAASLTNEKYAFDLTCDGNLESISMPGAGNGFLALDKNGDGKINDGNELFGPQTGNGFDELRKYDEDGNGWIDEADEVYSQLQVWSKDSEGNDILFTLKELDIGAIYLGEVSTNFTLTDESNNTQGAMRYTSVFLKDSGGAGTISHVDLLL